MKTEAKIKKESVSAGTKRLLKRITESTKVNRVSFKCVSMNPKNPSNDIIWLMSGSLGYTSILALRDIWDDNSITLCPHEGYMSIGCTDT